MNDKKSAASATYHYQPQAKRSRIGGVRRAIAFATLAVLALLLPCSLLADPIVVRINDVPNGPPVIQVQNAPNGWFFYTDEDIANPAIEEGGLVVLPGANASGASYDWAGRFVVPNAPDPNHHGVDIVWVENFDDILVVGFDSALPGVYYRTPGLFPNTDENLGPVTDNWVKVYADDVLVVLFKPHTYRLRN